ncbi:GRAS family transcription factor [Perilla frutescens var. hirtella]|uniref:GRAS family transcription factor n=1 Tax=Perilla frutescens var. hirtella TaxID=608512 RepID=A0AAD4IWI1_PERFH|nr:GRAS family transcription factor [Perilla frutescens var. hirtella]
MLGSFGSSSHDEEEEPSPPNAYLHHHHHHRQNLAPPPLHMRQVLISCAELISRSDLTAAHRLIGILLSNSSPYGDSTERLVHQFTKALSLRLNRCAAAAAASSSSIGSSTDDDALIQSSYLSLNQVTPFIRFSQLTANQAILEAIDGQQAIHILDFDIMHGVQWPPLMQAVAERFPPPTLRITGTGTDLEILRRTGDRLAKFAHSLGLRFQFHPLISDESTSAAAAASSVLLLPHETLVVNCVHYLHRLLKDRDRLRLFLHRIKAMSPRVLTVAEREANHNHPVFQQRFVEALDHYAAVFESLEATLPPASRERLAVEQIWFGKEIGDIVAAEGENRRERHERFRSWEMMLRNAGFSNVALSPFALSQAKLLLRLHYPSEGYQLHILNDSFFLGWQNQPLFSVSSWR